MFFPQRYISDLTLISVLSIYNFWLSFDFCSFHRNIQPSFYSILWPIFYVISILRSLVEITPVSTTFCGDYPYKHSFYSSWLIIVGIIAPSELMFFVCKTSYILYLIFYMTSEFVMMLLGTSIVMSQWIMMLLCVHIMPSQCTMALQWVSLRLLFITMSSYDIMKYPYAKTNHMISTEWSLTHLFFLYYLCSSLHRYSRILDIYLCRSLTMFINILSPFSLSMLLSCSSNMCLFITISFFFVFLLAVLSHSYFSPSSSFSHSLKPPNSCWYPQTSSFMAI